MNMDDKHKSLIINFLSRGGIFSIKSFLFRKKHG